MYSWFVWIPPFSVENVLNFRPSLRKHLLLSKLDQELVNYLLTLTGPFLLLVSITVGSLIVQVSNSPELHSSPVQMPFTLTFIYTRCPTSTGTHGVPLHSWTEMSTTPLLLLECWYYIERNVKPSQGDSCHFVYFNISALSSLWWLLLVFCTPLQRHYIQFLMCQDSKTITRTSHFYSKVLHILHLYLTRIFDYLMSCGPSSFSVLRRDQRSYPTTTVSNLILCVLFLVCTSGP